MRIQTAIFVVGLAALLSAAGCQTTERTPVYALTLAGAQISTDLVASWLDMSEQAEFVVTKRWPLRHAQDGFHALATGECDLACVDRRPGEKERTAFGDQPIGGRRLGIRGLALYVHDQNRLDAIFAGHLRMILRGDVTTWEPLAGDQIPDLTGQIRLYARGKDTLAGMQLAQMAGIFMATPPWTVCESDAEVVARVWEDPAALGFAAIGYDGDGVRYLGLRMERAGDAAFPSLEEIEAERYGLAQVIQVYFAQPPSAAVEAALEYLRSDVARARMAATEVFAIPVERSAFTVTP